MVPENNDIDFSTASRRDQIVPYFESIRSKHKAYLENKKQNIEARINNLPSGYLIAHSVIVLVFALFSFISFLVKTSNFRVHFMSLIFNIGIYTSSGVSTAILVTKRTYYVFAWSLITNSLSLAGAYVYIAYTKVLVGSDRNIYRSYEQI
ncbi:unnamed protein product [Brachionus calyciflorus]|uniref:Uncharacterized protein n=1 Tax=Brachionus calyciflorus TaxID=104777 RepID=A0A813U6B2_9BILA|nr:unnamed protein product [Brachionus calyciflorus]